MKNIIDDDEFVWSKLLAREPVAFKIFMYAIFIDVFILLMMLTLSMLSADGLVNLLGWWCKVIFCLTCGIYLTIRLGIWINLPKTDSQASMQLTRRLQKSLLRESGSNVNRQDRLAQMNNIRRLSCFVRKESGRNTYVIAIKQDMRQDINSMLDSKAMMAIASDIAAITGTNFTSWTDRTINDKGLFADHYRRYKVAVLV